ncbi:MAG: heat-inducible transcriptional repressor HrcA [Parachlamydiaceae bacterium]|nr:heat-inducible transcriptional repressor HrcA [Parachlamydiaceae bacterium]
MVQQKSVALKKTGKEERQERVLNALVEQYIKTGKAIGSHTLKESGFSDLSTATIRNYFASLEDQGYLTQQHSSGGRLPTHLAYRFYALQQINSRALTPKNQELCQELSSNESREIAAYLQQAAELLSQLTNCAVFLSAPRFDHDFITALKLVGLDQSRCLCVLITDFGVIQTELIYVDIKLSAFAIKRMEDYFQWRLTGIQKPENLEPEEELLAQKIYNELMLRYLVGYSNFTDEEIYRTGMSKLISYPEFQDPAVLSSSLALFENTHSMRLLLKECTSLNHIKVWIGDDLSSHTSETPNCTVAAIPYHINQQAVGAIGILSAVRIPYKEVFALLHAFSESITTSLTRNIYKFKIKYRQPKEESIYLQKEEHHRLGHSRLFLLEDLGTGQGI